MRALRPLQATFRSHKLPFLALGSSAVVWSGMCNVLAYYSLGIRSRYMSGEPMGLMLQWTIASFYAFVPCLTLVLICMFAVVAYTRWSPRWYLLLSVLYVLGTPIAIGGTHTVAAILWRSNTGGVPWELMVPPAAGFVASCVIVFICDRHVRDDGPGEPLGADRD